MSPANFPPFEFPAKSGVGHPEADVRPLPQECDRNPEAPELYQVWPLTQFFMFPFFYKIIDLPGWPINDPLSGKLFSLQFLPATPSSPSLTREGLFIADTAP